MMKNKTVWRIELIIMILLLLIIILVVGVVIHIGCTIIGIG